MGPSPDLGREAHRRFLNRYYRVSHNFYDATRRCFLFNRERALKHLLAVEWSTLVEVGPGTGRNLRKLHSARPRPWAWHRRGFAEGAEYAQVLGAPPERILFSYCLSMAIKPTDAARPHLCRIVDTHPFPAHGGASIRPQLRSRTIRGAMENAMPRAGLRPSIRRRRARLRRATAT